jgi:hypothetical protein
MESSGYHRGGRGLPGRVLRPPGREILHPRGGEKSGKRAQRDRLSNAETLLNWADEAGVILTPELEADIRDGFGASPDGEDSFDAVIGLFGMINVVLGYRTPGEPENEAIRKIDRWILGQLYLVSRNYVTVQ